MRSDTAVPPSGTDDLQLVVSELSRCADGVVSLVLADPQGRELPAWEPGAHVDVCMPGVTRQYSLCGDPRERGTYRLGVLLEPESRGGSKFIHEQLCAEQTLTVHPPRNHFALEDAAEYLFVAGGIGITPIVAMITEVERRGRPWRLVYGGRQRSSMAFLDELAAYGDKVVVRPQDEFGLLDLDEILDVPDSVHIYCCGPEPLIAAVEERCTRRAAGTLHVERFAARELPEAGEQTAFEVHCQESDVTVTVAAGQSMLDALLDAGVDLNFDCREGTCGSCELEVLEGRPLHLDSILSVAERETAEIIFPCVSRARSDRLVLDA
ncbi:PDR/VanB family oxidoreductase [Geodermatophilus ruber]|uniref:Ferredoxin-NADP reductase n=1 Tax=Geodermatophilus ruber TaxID=504800 RepID=A0A1I4H385_9ACTN|nr:PDR/VanB family oxidoreductase [Geodermatophilus ruber]SFL36655.1 Ferredoxin-NADP reductase [Geodermatophilus ruber]